MLIMLIAFRTAAHAPPGRSLKCLAAEIHASSEDIKGDEYDSASIEKSNSVDSDEYPSSTGWESRSEDKDTVHGTKVKKSNK